MRSFRLDALRLVRVAGADRISFLQGQLTQDVNAPGVVPYAWTNAQGRVLVTGHLWSWLEALWLTAPAGIAEDVVRRLRMFVLRAAVNVDLADLDLAGASLGAGAPRLDGVSIDVRPGACTGTDRWCALSLGGHGRRLLVAGPLPGAMGPDATPLAEAAWQLADVRDGVPQIAPATVAAFIPQTINLDLLGAVSFAKGCYSGQEVITRTRHLGRVKRRMFRYGAAHGPPPPPGEPVYGPAGPVGQVVNSATADGAVELLAAVELHALDAALSVEPGGRPLARLPLPYDVAGLPVAG